jgi:hypothetical protein
MNVALPIASDGLRGISSSRIAFEGAAWPSQVRTICRGALARIACALRVEIA